MIDIKITLLKLFLIFLSLLIINNLAPDFVGIAIDTHDSMESNQVINYKNRKYIL